MSGIDLSSMLAAIAAAGADKLAAEEAEKQRGNGPRFSLPATIAKGSRHTTLVSYAGQLKDKGLSDDEISTVLHSANMKLCKPPVPEDEIESIIESSKKFETNPRKFKHNEFGDGLIEMSHVKRIGKDGALAIWDGAQFRMGMPSVYKVMQTFRPSLRESQRKEIARYLQIVAPIAELAEPRYIAFDNGVLDIETLEMSEARPNIVIPNVIPHRWTAGASCPELDEALEAWACNIPDRAMLLKEIAGLCMYRGHDITACPILIGEGSNGKSTYLSLLYNLIGDENIAALDMATIGERFQSTCLVGKLANIGDDISNEFVNGSKLSIVKKAITGNPITGEYKGGDTFHFRPYCTLVFSVNDMPKLGDTSKGVYRRFLPVPFEAVFSRELGNLDPKLAESLSTEAATERLAYLGIMALKDSIDRGGLTVGDDQLRLLDDIKEANSSVYQYAREQLNYGTAKATDINEAPTSELYDDYTVFCDHAGCKPVPRNKFTTEMCKIYDAESLQHYCPVVGSDKKVQKRAFIIKTD